MTDKNLDIPDSLKLSPEDLFMDLKRLKCFSLTEIEEVFKSYRSDKNDPLRVMGQDDSWAVRKMLRAVVITKDQVFCEVEYTSDAEGYRIKMWIKDIRSPQEEELKKLARFNNGFYFIELNDRQMTSTVDEEVKKLLVDYKNSQPLTITIGKVRDDIKELPIVKIYPQDEKNSRAIMERIRCDAVNEEPAVRAIVDVYEFSSPETKQHTADRIVDLLKIGFFSQPPLKMIDLGEVSEE